jgi:hypothetical protein
MNVIASMRPLVHVNQLQTVYPGSINHTDKH